MVKLRTIQAYELEKVPDHIRQQVENLSIQMATQMAELCSNYEPNICLACIPWVMAALLRSFIVEEEAEVKNATLNIAIAVIRNMEFLTGFSIREGK
jgi:hypothetical protein